MRVDAVQTIPSPVHLPQAKFLVEEPETFRICRPGVGLSSAEKRYFYARQRIKKLVTELERKKEQFRQIPPV